MITLASLQAARDVSHGFFTRIEDEPDGSLSSRNCAFGFGDDPKRVFHNRALCMRKLDLPTESLLIARQRHLDTAVKVVAPFDPDCAPLADAMATRAAQLALGVLTADCAPVLLADPIAGVIGVAHAGWKGALNGILEATLETMASLGARPAHVIAGIGPCIDQRSYQVGPEFPGPFLCEDQHNRRFFNRCAHAGKFNFDLRGYVAHKLARFGVNDVTTVPGDACAEADRFFSYRRHVSRGTPDQGRMLSVIVLAHAACDR